MLRRTRTERPVSNNLDSSDLPRQIDAWVHTERSPLGKVILDAGWIDADQLTDALRAERDEGRRLGDVLIEAGLIDDHQLAEALAHQFQIPLVDLRHQSPEPAAVERVPEVLARRHTIMPMRYEAERVYVAIPDPLDVASIEELTQHCGRIGVFIAARSDILRVIESTYNALTAATSHIQAFQLTDEGPTDSSAPELEADENAPIVQVVNRILTQGVRSRASDIHIEPQEHNIRVRFRVDGAMNEVIQLPLRMGAPVASRIKVMADLNIVERRRPQDGQFSMEIDGRPVDVRTSVVATIHGEKVVMRVLDKTRSLIGLTELGMPSDVVGPYLNVVKAPLGMLLCTGPTGAGKTTTLYATLAEVNDPQKNVVTIEDPVEYQFAGVNQMQVSQSAGINFADGLRGILRQDPDVVLVGEIRDIETAQIAMQAALTGHLVLSSLHAVDAVAALHRFTDMGLEPFLVASAVTGVVGQRLLRRICDGCKVWERPPADQIRLVASQLGHKEAHFARGTGCNLCNGTGYQGRVGVYELLVVSDKIRQMIVDKATHSEMRKVAIAEGMWTMQGQAFQLVADGVTTVEEVIRSVYAPGMVIDSQQPVGELMAPKLELGTGSESATPGDDGVLHSVPNDLSDIAGVTEPHSWEMGA